MKTTVVIRKGVKRLRTYRQSLGTCLARIRVLSSPADKGCYGHLVSPPFPSPFVGTGSGEPLLTRVEGRPLV
jgi:hypothetical protein